ncbi:MAG: metal ABC transporter substrate-binding protein [Anaerolineae bacterium]
MTRLSVSSLLIALLMLAGVTACAAPARQPSATLKVLAVETFLADMAQNVAGDRLKVDSLIPIGVDPHGFEPTPQDVARIAESQVLIVNGAGFETWLDRVLANAGGRQVVVVASTGLAMREPGEGEMAHEHAGEATGGGTPPPEQEHAHHHEGDPHFWLDPVAAIKYVENIRDGLSAADPAGRETYAANAAAYIARLQELDDWIKAQVAIIPPERRLLVTNHESFGYFADRYGFTIVGTVIPSVSTGASPSAQEMAALVEHIKEAGAPAIFLETGSNPQLARQIAQEAGVKVVTELFTHSITDASGPAPNYIAMMRYNVQAIVEALK